jgi:uncharacterized repeat protein (TIGR01451 family)
MKPRYTVLWAVLLASITSWQAQAQLTFIADMGARDLYNSWVPGCVDANGYLDASSPAVQTFDPVDPATVFTMGTYSTHDMAGLDAFTSLRRLYFTANVADTFLVTYWPPNLEELRFISCQRVGWSALPASLRRLYVANTTFLPDGALPPLNEGLTLFSMDHNDGVGTVALPSTLQELYLYTWAGPFPTLPSGLKKLRLSQCWNGTMPEIANSQLEYLSIGLVNTIDNDTLEFPSTLRYFQCTGSYQIAFDLGQLPNTTDSIQLQSIFLNQLMGTNMPEQLKYLSLDGVDFDVPSVMPSDLREMHLNHISTMTEVPHFFDNLRILEVSNCPISCIPLLPDSLQMLTVENTQAHCIPNQPVNCVMNTPGIGALCSILSSTCPANNPGVSGQVYHDANGNGQFDAGEQPSSYVSVLVEPLGLTSGVPTNGNYVMGVPIGDHTVTATPTSPYVLGISPASHVVSLPTISSTDTDNDFALTLSLAQDLVLSIATSPARPGFTSELWVTVQNVGTILSDVTVQLEFDSDQSWVASDPAPSTLNGNTATFDLIGLQMGEYRMMHVTLYTGAVLNGTELIHIATLTGVPNDVQPADNVAVSTSTVVGSFDPNDKSVTPNTISDAELTTADFTYTVRFQNTGTYPAERVVITDTLSTALDWSTFRFVSSSHLCNWTLYNGVLRFTFEPIFLPDSASDESGSHGFVSFRMKPSETTGLSTITNVANIYFDYNAPVITNEAVVDVSNSVKEESAETLRVFPVPADQTLWLQRLQPEQANMRIMDAQGRVVMERMITGLLVAIPVGELPPGAYVVTDLSGSGTRASFLKR